MDSQAKEDVLKQIQAYGLTDIRRALIVSFVNKICLSVIAPVPMVGNSQGDDRSLGNNIPGVYWDDKNYYIDVEVNEDNQTLSLFGRDRSSPRKEIWIESFRVMEENEPYLEAWLEKYFKPFLLS